MPAPKSTVLRKTSALRATRAARSPGVMAGTGVRRVIWTRRLVGLRLAVGTFLAFLGRRTLRLEEVRAGTFVGFVALFGVLARVRRCIGAFGARRALAAPIATIMPILARAALMMVPGTLAARTA